MKNTHFALLIVSALLLGACASAAPAAETAEPVVVEEQAAAAMETPMVEEAAPAAESEADSAVEAVSFSQDVWPILEKYALAAHGGKGGVFLESYDDILKYVSPGDPENSMLYKALIGDGMQRMPPDTPLPDELIQTIYDWIQQGALNN